MYLLFSFLLAQKRNKKRHTKTITARFRACSLRQLLYCCDLTDRKSIAGIWFNQFVQIGSLPGQGL